MITKGMAVRLELVPEAPFLSGRCLPTLPDAYPVATRDQSEHHQARGRETAPLDLVVSPALPDNQGVLEPLGE